MIVRPPPRDAQAWGSLSNTVDLTLHAKDAFAARFQHTSATLQGEEGLSAAFLVKEAAEWHSSYVVVIDERCEAPAGGWLRC